MKRVIDTLIVSRENKDGSEEVFYVTPAKYSGYILTRQSWMYNGKMNTDLGIPDMQINIESYFMSLEQILELIGKEHEQEIRRLGFSWNDDPI